MMSGYLSAADAVSSGDWFIVFTDHHRPKSSCMEDGQLLMQQFSHIHHTDAGRLRHPRQAASTE